MRLIGSKWALLQSGKVYLVGEFENYRGLQCSNLNWTSYLPDWGGLMEPDENDEIWAYLGERSLEIYSKYYNGELLTKDENEKLDDILLCIDD